MPAELVDMFIAMFFSAGIGCGVLICIRAIWPRPETLGHALVRIDAPRRREQIVDASRGETLSQLVVDLVERIRPTSGLGQAFELTGRTPEQHAVMRLAGGLAGATMAVTIVVASSGSNLAVPLAAAGGAVGGFLLADRDVQERANKTRRAIRHALGSYLGLVNILIAGGAGIESALEEAADIGDGPAFRRLRLALDRSHRTGQTPWQELAAQGEHLGVTELRELAANVSLAGNEGARIRMTLAAKANSTRGHLLAETETQAKVGTERMTIPLVVLLGGFFLLIAYPAFADLSSVTHVPVP